MNQAEKINYVIPQLFQLRQALEAFRRVYYPSAQHGEAHYLIQGTVDLVNQEIEHQRPKDFDDYEEAV